MKFTIVSLLLSTLAVAAPAPAGNPAIPESWKRSMESNLDMVRRTTQLTDTDILNFALTLEHLEDTFYALALKKFTKADFTKAGYDSAVRSKVRSVAYDEATHVATLTAALGKDAVPACKYDFGITDVKSFMEIAPILEGVGVTAYLGAAALIMDPSYLTVAGSILTVEARHSAYLRDSQLNPQSPFPQPFDVPLSVLEVYTLASPFITKCPKKANLGLTAFPALTLTGASKVPLMAGDTATFAVAKGTTIPSKAYAAFLYVTGPIFTPVTVKGNAVTITIPKGVAGQSYAVLTSNSSSTADKYIIAGPGIVEIKG